MLKGPDLGLPHVKHVLQSIELFPRKEVFLQKSCFLVQSSSLADAEEKFLNSSRSEGQRQNKN